MRAVIEKEVRIIGATAAQRSEIQRRLTFDNPVYLGAERAGRWTGGIDRHIHAYRVDAGDLVVPWGCRDLVFTEVVDQTVEVPAEIECQTQLRDYQQVAVDAMLTAGGGVLVAPTGSGKTMMAIAMCAALKQRTLILVKSLALADQWVDAVKTHTGLDARVVGSGKKIGGEQFTIGIMATMVKSRELCSGYGNVIVDEAHNVPARQTMDVLASVDARYRFGLTATPARRDGLEGMLFAALGHVVHEVPDEALDGAVLPVKVLPVHLPWTGGHVAQFTDFPGQIARDEVRHQTIVEWALLVSAKVPTIILCNQTEQCDRLGELLPGSLVVHGKLPGRVRAERTALMQTAQLVIGTYSLLSEGVDVPRLGCLLLGSPVSSSDDRKSAIRLIQSIGRVRRPFEGKTHAYVIDYIEDHGISRFMWNKRQDIYRQHGFELVKRRPVS